MPRRLTTRRPALSGALCASALLFAALLVAAAAAAAAAAPQDFDVLVYGASPSGIAAAITAANGTGLRVALLEPTAFVGGMSGPGGIGLRDTASPAAIDGASELSVQAHWLRLINAHYGAGVSGVRQPDAAVAMAAWDALVADARYGLTVVRNAALDEAPGAVVKSGLAVVSIRTVDTSGGPAGAAAAPQVWTAKVFIDATYEADLVVASGARYAIGRESNDTYGEKLAGVQSATTFQQFPVAVNPFWPNGTLLAGVEAADAAPAPGEADDRVMPSSFRACITQDPALLVPWPRPDGYDEAEFELLIRLAEARGNATRFTDLVAAYEYFGYSNTGLPMLYDLCENSELSTDQPSETYTQYILGNRSVREAIRGRVLRWIQGWAFTLANAPRVPEGLRASAASWGLCSSAFASTSNWPLQMYVREGVRLQGDYVATQVNTVAGACVPDAIALGAWTIDIHLMRRHAGTRNGVPSTENEGEVGFANFPGQGGVYEVPYGIILPRRADVSNLLATNVPSTSHVAFGAMRVEPFFIALGTAAGVAATLAARGGIAVQDVDVGALQTSLAAVGQCLHWHNSSCTPSC